MNVFVERQAIRAVLLGPKTRFAFDPEREMLQ
jgi:hypothetical protein